MYCVLDLNRVMDTIIWHNSEEATEFANAGRWTELINPVCVPNTCIELETNIITAQPMVIFENETLLDVADRIPKPDHHNGEYLHWQPLKKDHPDYFAACASESAVEAMLNDWAEGLLKRFDAMMGAHRHRTDLKRIADFALCATRSRTLRWKAFIRYAASQEPDKVQRTFDRFIHAEFPQVSWDVFVSELKTLRDVWDAQPVFQQDLRVTSTSGSVTSKVKDIVSAPRPKLVRL